jgi:hypothetical protein
MGLRLAPVVLASIATLAFANLGASCQPDPYAPRNLRVVPAPGPCRLSLEWDPPAQLPPTGIAQYNVYREGQRVAETGSAVHYLDDPTWLGWDSAVPSYVVSVHAVDGAGVELTGAKAKFTVPDCPSPPPVLLKHVGAVLLTFPDSPPAPFDHAGAVSLIFTGPSSLREFWNRNAYGRQFLAGSAASVRGWFTMPAPLTSYCDGVVGGLGVGCDTGGAMRTDAVAVAQAAGVDFTLGDYWYLIYNGIAAAGHNSSVPLLGGSIPGAWIGARSLQELGSDLLAHEMGHSAEGAGIYHGNMATCPSSVFPPNAYDLSVGGCSYLEDDPHDVMGSNWHVMAEFSAHNRERLGFLAPQRIKTADLWTPGSSVVQRLYLLQDDPLGGEAIQLLKARTSQPALKAAYVLVEYTRIADGSFAVVVRFKPGDEREAIYGATLGVGATPFEDLGQHVKVDRIASGTSQLGRWVDVRVTSFY